MVRNSRGLCAYRLGRLAGLTDWGRIAGGQSLISAGLTVIGLAASIFGGRPAPAIRIRAPGRSATDPCAPEPGEPRPPYAGSPFDLPERSPRAGAPPARPKTTGPENNSFSGRRSVTLAAPGARGRTPTAPRRRGPRRADPPRVPAGAELGAGGELPGRPQPPGLRKKSYPAARSRRAFVKRAADLAEAHMAGIGTTLPTGPDMAFAEHPAVERGRATGTPRE
jgi:hypothetical protein